MHGISWYYFGVNKEIKGFFLLVIKLVGLFEVVRLYNS